MAVADVEGVDYSQFSALITAGTVFAADPSREAAFRAFELAKAAGYDVNRFADFFKKLERYQKQDLIKKLTSTHPFAEHRKKCIQSYIDQ